jgi:hypothetical protein
MRTYDLGRDYSNPVTNHIHDYGGYTEYAGQGSLYHNHGFMGTTGRGIPVTQNFHVHRYYNPTDTVLGHYHYMSDTTGINVSTGRGRHVHDAYTMTTVNAGHRHAAAFTTGLARMVGTLSPAEQLYASTRSGYYNRYGNPWPWQQT